MSDSVQETFGLHRTYTGLLDDVMIRYSGEFATEAFFNKTIAKSIFFGYGVYINDGYLVNHPLARKYLGNENSLLRAMLSQNFIRILTRTKDANELAQMPVEMGKTIPSFKRLVDSDEWRFGLKDEKPFEELWAELTQAAFFRNNPRGWPPVNMSHGISELMKRVFEKKDSPSEVGLFTVTRDEVAEIEQEFFCKGPSRFGCKNKTRRSCTKSF